MRIVLSKKGVDTSYGNMASIVENGVFYSIPIPEPKYMKETRTRYSDIKLKNGLSLFDKIKNYYPKFEDNICHVDPNISNYFGATHGIIGQVDKAQTFLENKIGIGDIFLFFGRYAEVRDNEVIGYERAIIWGYLIVSEIIKPQQITATERAKKEKQYPWIKANPHWNFKDYENKPNNCIYIGKDYGVFDYSPELNLTLPYSKPRYWGLPKELNGLKIESEMSAHNGTIKNGTFTLATTFGQEFVVEESERATKWALSLIEKHKTKK